MKADRKAVIVDYRADEAIVKKLKSLGYDVVFSVNNTEVSPNLSGHPDIQICKCNESTYVCAPHCYEYYKNALEHYGVKVYSGNSCLGCNYPEDIAYNVARVGNTGIHNFRYTDSVIVNFFKNNNIKMINVPQGYSKCNICIVSDNAIITSDMGIYKSLITSGIEVLLISEAGIDIFGWDCGFIGGASGKLDEDILAFCGDVTTHPDGNKIIDFCVSHNVNCVSLSGGRLMDLGTLILVNFPSA